MPMSHKEKKARCNFEFLQARTNLFWIQFEALAEQDGFTNDSEIEEILYMSVEAMVGYDMIVRKDKYFPKGGNSKVGVIA